LRHQLHLAVAAAMEHILFSSEIVEDQQVAVAELGLFDRLLNGHGLQGNGLAGGDDMRFDDRLSRREGVHGDHGAGLLAGTSRFRLRGLRIRLGGAGFGPGDRRRGKHLLFRRQPFARHPSVPVTARLAFGVLQRQTQRRLQRVGLARGYNGLHPGLDRHLGDLLTLLRAERNAGARAFAQNAGNPFHTFFGLLAQRLGDTHLPGGVLHFHGQPPLLDLLAANEKAGELRILHDQYSVVSSQFSAIKLNCLPTLD
jgi:hypothetical protein